MVIDDFNYQKEVEIDESSLDLEWLNHPSKVLKVTELQAQLKKELDMASEELSCIKAELDLAIRRDPRKYGIEKITETAIGSATQMDENYQEATQKVIDARYEYQNAQGAVTAFDHRKSSLENLVKLLNQGYFAGPSLPRNISEEKELKSKNATQKIGGALRRSKLKRDSNL